MFVEGNAAREGLNGILPEIFPQQSVRHLSGDGLKQQLRALALRQECFVAASVIDWSVFLTDLELMTLMYDLLRTDAQLSLVMPVYEDSQHYRHAGAHGCIRGNLHHLLQAAGFVLKECEMLRLPDCPDDAPLPWELWRLQKQQHQRWRVADAGLSAAGQVEELFEQVFALPMKRMLRQWKYGDGRGQGVVVYQGQEIIGHYGGLRRDVLLHGQPETVMFMADVMVHLEGRRTLTRKGPFFLMASIAIEQFMQKASFSAGFPNNRAMRLGEKLGLYDKVGRMAAIYWTAKNRLPNLNERVRTLDFPVGAELIDRAWQVMRQGLKDYVAGVRNYEYVRHRYLTHPEKQYQLFAVTRRFSGRLLGVFVIGDCGNGVFELLDLIGDMAYFPVMVAQACRVTARLGGGELFCWVCDHMVPLLNAHNQGRVDMLDVDIPVNTVARALDKALVQDQWWLMGGDTDDH